ncbi:MAG: type II toxin-antitoxin system VapC family toxin [Betaproteobacteria bacterium]
MAALDTNILVRWLTNDDAKQCAIVLRLFDAAINKEERLFVTLTVMLEVEWVLRTRYHFDRQMVTAALNALLDVTELEFQEEPALEQALWLFKQAGARDFADCLHIALASQTGHGPLLTLDERASKIEGAQLLRG